jgi:ATP-dependent helicase/nuclease subunit A
MSSAAFLPFSDDADRRAAIDPRRSFTVQAPAGSGKTELLIQRYLNLLAVVEKPETIVAITFTRKAAGEMRGRILDALREAKAGTGIGEDQPHKKFMRELALRAMARDEELGWDLLNHPNRLRVDTIDALALSVAAAMPWLARLGAMPRIEDDVTVLYNEAAKNTVLEIGGGEYSASLSTLLDHLDNDASRLRELIAAMLARRDQWMDITFRTSTEERSALEEALQRAVRRQIARVDAMIPSVLHRAWLNLASLDNWPPADAGKWGVLADAVLTKAGEWRRKGMDSEFIDRLRSIDGLREALKDIRSLPPERYTDAQWSVMQALFDVLGLAVAQLHHVFRERNIIDFCEIGQAARRALEEAGNPTELAFRLDSRIDHLLIDEFQDTSRGQFEFIEKLISGWEPDDGRTLFIVGDPMQSIYRFRQAEVSLFLQVQKAGMGSLRPESLTLSSNYRTVPALLDRINFLNGEIFPQQSDSETGAITFTPSHPEVRERECEYTLHSFGFDDRDGEAARVVELVRAARAAGEKTAILVRARTHLRKIVPKLKDRGLQFQAVDVDPLTTRPVVQDLLALTRAMLHPGDRISWLAILRAPWCGLTLADLDVLVRENSGRLIWEMLDNTSALSTSGQRRVARLRDVLSQAFAGHGRWPLRRWVERAWIALGGPACLNGDRSALQDASDYLDLLEREQSGCDLRDFDGFPGRVQQLFAKPDPRADDSLQIMTIHQAKGLEFDTVILPGLGRGEKVDDSPLFLFHEWRENGKLERLLAPITAAGENGDPHFQYLRQIDRRKSKHERLRLFYVASTRAKKRLHLLGQAKLNKDGEPAPESGSILADLWRALSLEEKARFAIPNSSANAHLPLAPGVLRRLPESWKLPELPAPLTWAGSGPLRPEPHEPTFEWVGEGLRIAGTVVHGFLQRMRDPGAELPGVDAIRAALLHAGLSPAELPEYAARVRDALQNVRESPRAQWILQAHRDSRSEYAVTGVVNGEIVRGKVDRTFVDSGGIRWIVDFKTSSHSGGNVQKFLDEEQRRYRDQMERYARLFASEGRPVRLGLYFPLLDAWREWTPET